MVATSSAVNAAIYSRISLDASGEGLGVARQTEKGHSLCHARDWVPAYELCDNDLSASGSVERPDFKRLLHLVETGQVGAIVAQAMDRLCRNQRDGVNLLQSCKRHKVKLAFLNGGDLDLSSSMGLFVANMMILMAELETNTKAERQTLANRQRAQLGVVRIGSPRPFGWMEDRITPHPVEGPAVVEGYATILAGGSIRSVVARWNAAGLAPPQGPRKATKEQGRSAHWRSGQVKNVLLNPRHCGRTSIGGVIEGEVRYRNNGGGRHEPVETTKLVDDDTYTAARALLTDQGRTTAVRGVRSLLGGIALCHCGVPVVAGQSPRGKPSYRHQPPPGMSDGRPHIGRQREPVDRYISGLVVARMSREDAKDLLRRDDDGPDLRELWRQREAVMTRAREVAEAFADPTFAMGVEQVRAANEKLAARLAEIDAAIEACSQASVLRPLVGVENVAAAWDAMHVDQKRAIIRELFAHITLHRPGMGSVGKPVHETVSYAFRDALD